jgi:hypothetical protein
MRGSMFVACVALLVAGSAVAQAGEEGAVSLHISDATLLDPLVYSVASGVHAVAILGQPGDVYGGVFVWPATAPGDFQLSIEGLLFHGALNGDGDLRSAVSIPPVLIGSLVTAAGLVLESDGVSVRGSAIYTYVIS